MRNYNNISLRFSIIITILVIIPIILLIGIVSSDFLAVNIGESREYIKVSAFITFILCIFSILLYIPSIITNLVGTSTNNSTCVKVGFGLGLPSWILSLIATVFIFLVYEQTEYVITDRIISILLLYISGFNQLHFLFIISIGLPQISTWLTIFTGLNIASAIICIVFSSIILNRSKYLIS